MIGWLGEKAVSHSISSLIQMIPGMESFAVPGWVSVAIAFTILTMAHIIIGEQVPKFLAIRFPESLLLKLGLPFRLFCKITSPFIWLMNSMANGCIRLMGFKDRPVEQSAPSSDEFRILVGESRKAGLITKQEADLLVRSLELKGLTARQVMLPRAQFDALHEGMSLEEVVRTIDETKHSKFPVFDSIGDRVIGLLYAKDLFETWLVTTRPGGAAARPVGEDFSLRNYVRQAYVVPDTMPSGSLLEEMKSKHRQMAIVVNEFGSTVGLVTLEDLVEQLVGEIWDEFDTPLDDIRSVSKECWLVAGEVTLFEFNKRFDSKLECEGHCSSIAGYVTERLGHKARIGESVSQGRFRFKVLEKEGHAISLLEVTIKS